MDIDLALLGPYGKLFKEKGGVFKGSGVSGPATFVTANRVQFEAVHKKRNVRFDQDSESRRQARQLTQEQIRKERRSNILINKRDPKMAILAEDFDALIHEDSSNEISAIECSYDSGNSSTEPSTSQEALDNHAQPKVTGNGKATAAKATPMKNGVNVKPILKPTPKPVVTNGTNGRSNVDISNNNKTNSRPKVNPIPISNLKTGKVAPVPSISDSRREKLERWKKEKEAGVAAQRNQRQPFKAGLAAATAPAKTAVTVGTGVAKTLTKPPTVFSRAPLPTVASHTSKTQPATRGAPLASKPVVVKPKPEETRRVMTRAMSKVQPLPSSSSSTRAGVSSKPTATAGVKPTIQKMKNLNISEKNKPTATTGKPGGVTGPTSKPGIIGSARAGPSQTLKPSSQLTKSHVTTAATTVKKVIPPSQPKSTAVQSKPAQRLPSTRTPTPVKNKITPVPVSQRNSTDTGETVESNSVTPESATVPASTIEPPKEVAKKKMKPKAIDSAYIDFNSQFSSACLKLKSYLGTWTEFLEDKDTSEISEKNLGDIRSALGKVKLLLGSKLPQFGELLFSYLCQQVDPNPVLACDLQGWWDVTSIQLEAVDKIFEDLSVLRDNNWNDSPQPPPIEVKPLTEDNTSAEVSRIIRPTRVMKPSAKATGGLRAFLANKRKMINKAVNGGNNVTENGLVVVNENEDTGGADKLEETLILPNNERTFDQISSPKPRSVDKLRKQETPASPNYQGSGSLNSSTLSFHSALPMTPTRRNSQRLSTTSDASLRRISMGILAVRQSYGSFMKIGVKPMASEDMDESITSMAENSMDEAEDEMQFD